MAAGAKKDRRPPAHEPGRQSAAVSSTPSKFLNLPRGNAKINKISSRYFVSRGPVGCFSKKIVGGDGKWESKPLRLAGARLERGVIFHGGCGKSVAKGGGTAIDFQHASQASDPSGSSSAFSTHSAPALPRFQSGPRTNRQISPGHPVFVRSFNPNFSRPCGGSFLAGATLHPGMSQSLLLTESSFLSAPLVPVREASGEFAPGSAPTLTLHPISPIHHGRP